MKTHPFLVLLLCTIYFIYSSCKKDKVAPGELLKEIVDIEGQSKWTLRYNTDGKITGIAEGGGDTVFYNSQGQPIKYKEGSITYKFEYNTRGQIINKVPFDNAISNYHPDTLEYRYDAKGRVVQCLSTCMDYYNNPQEGWTRTYSYNDQNDIIEYNALHTFYNQSENEKLKYDMGRNPLKLSNSILFFLNENLYHALNEHNPVRIENMDYNMIYSYDYYSGGLPFIRTIKYYRPGQPISPFTFLSSHSAKFIYQ